MLLHLDAGLHALNRPALHEKYMHSCLDCIHVLKEAREYYLTNEFIYDVVFRASLYRDI